MDIGSLAETGMEIVEIFPNVFAKKANKRWRKNCGAGIVVLRLTASTGSGIREFGRVEKERSMRLVRSSFARNSLDRRCHSMSNIIIFRSQVFLSILCFFVAISSDQE
jgi:hypothetical protein